MDIDKLLGEETVSETSETVEKAIPEAKSEVATMEQTEKKPAEKKPAEKKAPEKKGEKKPAEEKPEKKQGGRKFRQPKEQQAAKPQARATEATLQAIIFAKRFIERSLPFRAGPWRYRHPVLTGAPQ